jgi:hypothetical protein
MWKVMVLSLLAAMPSSTNYTLKAYDFGNGSNNSGSTNYNLRSSVNANGGKLTSANYVLPAGIRASTTVPVPTAPTLTNPNNSYSSLQLVLSVGTFPSDTKYAIAISDDNFATTKYVKSDMTIASTFSIANYQTYASWGGASGAAILGLNNGTTYKVKVAALQGSSTGSAFGPTASAATSVPSATFSMITSLTSTPPFATTFASLPSGSVVTGDATVTATVTTNASLGGSVLVKDSNAGLNSSTASYTITSATTDLTSASKGYGAQVSSTSQSSGGPMVSLSPFNGSSNNVGLLNTSWQQLASFAAPVTSGAVTFSLKAKADTTVPAATNYSDAITVTISLLF